VKRSLAILAILAAGSSAPALAQHFYVPPSGFAVENPVLRRIWALGMDSSEAQSLAQALLDSIGPRLTASPGIEAAQDWLLAAYQRWGVAAHRERTGTWRAWRRGVTHIDLVAPRVRTLEGQMLAWSPSTPGGRPVRAPVVALPDVADSAAFVAWLPQARGTFVLVSFPPPTCRPDESWERWALPATVDSMKARRAAAQRAWEGRIARTGYEFRYGHHSLLRRLEQAGVAGLVTNAWAQGWGVDRIFDAQVERAPVVSVSCEDYGLLARLAEHRQGPVLELKAQAEVGAEVPVFNVVAELRGAELPDEYVILSAHIDSWDGGSGALDDGAGSVMMLEAMRLLARTYPHPRRTILVGHWTGEEQGLEGSRAFVADHPRIVDSLQAAFNQDDGTGRVVAMDASGFTAASGNLARYLAVIPGELTREIRFSFPGPAGPPDDYASFVGCGAPAFDLASADWDYFQYGWHTQRDTYDKISFDDLKQNATLVAMLAYLASEDPQFLPRDRRTIFPVRRDGTAHPWLKLDCTPPDRRTPPPG
jgi:hypothetical protein